MKSHHSTTRLTPPLHRTGHELKSLTQADVFALAGLPRGLCLGSKSLYRADHEKHCFVPNANVFGRAGGKIWWGDLDLWHHARQLEWVAKRLRCRLYVLYEHDGLFVEAELSFAEVRQRAVWHTGGRVRPDRRLIRRSGLSFRALALLAGVSRERLLRPQLPFVAQQINRKLLLLEQFFGPFARYAGFGKWGEWLSTRNSKLNGRSPLEVFRSGGSIRLDEIFPDVFANPKRMPKFEDSMLRGLELQSSEKITVEWPPRFRRPATR